MKRRRVRYGRACHSCKMAHRLCDGNRPCARCAGLELQHECRDSEPKNKGRPRKRANTNDHDNDNDNDENENENSLDVSNSDPANLVNNTAAMKDSFPQPIFASTSSSNPLPVPQPQLQNRSAAPQQRQQHTQNKATNSGQPPSEMDALSISVLAPTFTAILDQLKELTAQTAELRSMHNTNQEEFQRTNSDDINTTTPNLSPETIMAPKPRSPSNRLPPNSTLRPQPSYINQTITPPTLFVNHETFDPKTDTTAHNMIFNRQMPRAGLTCRPNISTQLPVTDDDGMPFIIDCANRAFMVGRRDMPTPRDPSTINTNQTMILHKPNQMKHNWSKIAVSESFCQLVGFPREAILGNNTVKGLVPKAFRYRFKYIKKAMKNSTGPVSPIIHLDPVLATREGVLLQTYARIQLFCTDEREPSFFIMCIDDAKELDTSNPTIREILLQHDRLKQQQKNSAQTRAKNTWQDCEEDEEDGYDNTATSSSPSVSSPQTSSSSPTTSSPAQSLTPGPSSSSIPYSYPIPTAAASSATAVTPTDDEWAWSTLSLPSPPVYSPHPLSFSIRDSLGRLGMPPPQPSTFSGGDSPGYMSSLFSPSSSPPLFYY